VHSPHAQTISDLQCKLRDLPQYLAPAVSEVWLRRYQVLPGRTHPLMNMSGSGGFMLHTIKVYDDPAANSVTAHRHHAKKARVSSETASADSPSAVAGTSSDGANAGAQNLEDGAATADDAMNAS